ncbi:MAG: hypothetical protein ACRD2U_11035 [Terriglobales bacterium]
MDLHYSECTNLSSYNYRTIFLLKSRQIVAERVIRVSRDSPQFLGYQVFNSGIEGDYLVRVLTMKEAITETRRRLPEYPKFGGRVSGVLGEQ